MRIILSHGKVNIFNLATIDVRATLKKKLDIDFRPYTILGACNPEFALRRCKAKT